MNSYIFLDNVRFFAYHGVGQQEREVGNEFVINLKLKVDIARAAETDDVTPISMNTSSDKCSARILIT